jgi:hypothetical protein
MSEAMRQRKRYNAAVAKHGVCAMCEYRQETDGVWHCQNTPARKHPDCMSDNGVGRFRFDPSVMEQFRDRGNA